MTSNKKTKTAKPAENSVDNAVAANADTPEKKSTLTALLKEALAAKNENQQLQKNSRKIDKGKKIGMPPRGTRRSMGKR